MNEQQKTLKMAMDLFDKFGPEGVNELLKATSVQTSVCACGTNVHRIFGGRWIKSGGLDWRLSDEHPQHEPTEIEVQIIHA